MAGGTFTSYNKVRAGVYIRFTTSAPTSLTVGERGVVAICEPLSWGPIGVVNAIDANTDLVPLTGYSYGDSHLQFLTEMFKGTNRTPGPSRVLLFRPAATSSAKAAVTTGNLTATAAYDGTRGNDITIKITSNLDSTFTVETIVDGTVVDAQIGTTVASLTDNAWVKFTGSGNLAATAGSVLTGGANGTVAAANHSAFLTAIEPYDFDIIAYDGTDATTAAAYIAFIKRIADENGQYAQLVIANQAADSRFVINVVSGATLADGTSLTANQVVWWVAGAQAGARYNESLTFAQYPGAVACTAFTNAQYVTNLNAGKFMLVGDESIIKVESDINSLVSVSTDIGSVYKKNRIMRLCNTIANDIYTQFSEFIGAVNNDEDGRSRFKGAIVGYLLDIEAGGGIQNFDPDDVTVEAGPTIDSIIITVAIQVIDSVEKIYLTVEVS